MLPKVFFVTRRYRGTDAKFDSGLSSRDRSVQAENDAWTCCIVSVDAPGMATVRYFRAREYNWTGLSQHKTVAGKAARSLAQFTPYSWDDFNWRMFSSPVRCLQVHHPSFCSGVRLEI